MSYLFTEPSTRIISGRISPTDCSTTCHPNSTFSSLYSWLPPRKADYRTNDLLADKLQLLPAERRSDLSDWIHQINAFAHHEMRDYTQHALQYLQIMSEKDGDKHLSDYLWEMKGGYDSWQPGSRLIQYGE